jgi:anti-sigma factor ChrR (cupin superfamily)
MLGQVQIEGEIAVEIVHLHDGMRTPEHASHQGLEKMKALAGQRVREPPES